jgi:hypothetical protein
MHSPQKLNRSIMIWPSSRRRHTSSKKSRVLLLLKIREMRMKKIIYLKMKQINREVMTQFSFV